VQKVVHTPQCVQMMGFCVASLNMTARTEQAGSHLRHPMHLSGMNRTPPPGRASNAATGHAAMQAGDLQPRHTIAIKLLDKQPFERTLTAHLSNAKSS